MSKFQLIPMPTVQEDGEDSILELIMTGATAVSILLGFTLAVSFLYFVERAANVCHS